MAISTKAARNIVVNGLRYRWRATGNDGWISLVISPQGLPGARIPCTFDYHQTGVPGGGGRITLTRQLVITNRIVRRVVEYALRAGYDPREEATQLNLGAA